MLIKKSIKRKQSDEHSLLQSEVKRLHSEQNNLNLSMQLERLVHSNDVSKQNSTQTQHKFLGNLTKAAISEQQTSSVQTYQTSP